VNNARTIRQTVKWGNKKDILQRREEKKQKDKGETPRTAVVITDKQNEG
jgi:hypothetical protein